MVLNRCNGLLQCYAVVWSGLVWSGLRSGCAFADQDALSFDSDGYYWSGGPTC